MHDNFIIYTLDQNIESPIGTKIEIFCFYAMIIITATRYEYMVGIQSSVNIPDH